MAAEADAVIDVIVEIPRGSRNKYEYDHERHVIRLDRRLFSATEGRDAALSEIARARARFSEPHAVGHHL
jgi:hypothetical protein